MGNARIQVLITLAALPFACGRGRTPIQSDQVKIYSAVLLDFKHIADPFPPAPQGLLDLNILAPIYEPANGQESPVASRHSLALVDSLRARGLLIGVCDSAKLNGHAACRSDLPGPEYALSTIRSISTDSAVVSILMNSVCTTRERLCFDFAVSYRYLLVRRATKWVVAEKILTMIT